jgi:integrase/recombinase XerD
MKRDEHGIARALRMRAWKDHKGGLPQSPDPFKNGKAGAYDKACLDWLASLRLRNLSPATIETYRWALLRYRSWLLSHHRGGFKRLSSLVSARHAIAFQQDLLDEEATPHTRAYLLANLKRLTRWLSANHHLPRDPLQGLEAPRTPKHQLPRYLPLATVETLLEVPDVSDPLGIRDRAILEVFYATGLRRRELALLELQDLDFHQRQIRVRFGKGGKQRMIPAGCRAFGWLRRYLAHSRPRLSDSAEPDCPLFVTGYGDAFSPGSIGHMIRDYLNRMGFKRPGACHLLRHSCATHLMDGGAGLKAIQRMLGHSRLDTTAIYTHVSNRKLTDIHAKCHPHGDDGPFGGDPDSRSPGSRSEGVPTSGGPARNPSENSTAKYQVNRTSSPQSPVS